MQAGQRYDRELHVRIAGDRDAGMRYMTHARKLMGTVLADAQHSGLGVHSMRQQLPDGTQIQAEKIGEINRVTIVPPPPPAPEIPLRPPDDFVVWARDVDRPDGIDEEHPQQILRAAPEGSGFVWKTFFYSASTEGHDDFPGEKGTYVGLFPEGLRHAGNVDWEGPHQQRLSWYGPSSRYWPDAYVQPRAQFGKFVFMLGEVVLDTDAYATASDEQEHGPDRYVLGAAVRRIDGAPWLYVVQSEALPEPEPSLDPLEMASALKPYSTQDNEGGVYRYRLLVAADIAGVPRYSVSPNSRELMLSLPANHAEPWFFNRSCSAAHCYLLAADGWYMSQFGDEELVSPVPAAVPNPVQLLRRITITDELVQMETDEALTCALNGPPVKAASDYQGDTIVHATVRFTGAPNTDDATLRVWWDIGGIEFAQYDRQVFGTAPAGFPITEERNAHVAFADLRTGLLVRGLHERGSDGSSVFNTWSRCAFEVSLAGQLQGRVVVFERASEFGIEYPLTAIANGSRWTGLNRWPLAPSYFVYGVGTYCRPDNVDPEAVRLSQYAGGVNPSFAWLPYPSASYFGATATWASYFDDGLQLVRDLAPSGFQGSREDFDGQRSVGAGQASNGAVVYSGWRPALSTPSNPTSWDGNQSFQFATGSTLQTLTGVSGSRARSHPVWLLGKPPRSI